jgi:hypothetical protein
MLRFGVKMANVIVVLANTMHIFCRVVILAKLARRLRDMKRLLWLSIIIMAGCSRQEILQPQINQQNNGGNEQQQQQTQLATFRGTVTLYPFSTPVAGAAIQLPDLGLSTTTNINGIFQLTNTIIGQHVMQVTAPLSSTYTYYTVNYTHTINYTLTCEENKITECDIVLYPVTGSQQWPAYTMWQSSSLTLVLESNSIPSYFSMARLTGTKNTNGLITSWSQTLAIGPRYPSGELVWQAGVDVNEANSYISIKGLEFVIGTDDFSIVVSNDKRYYRLVKAYVGYIGLNATVY